ncbi:SIR2 family protein [Priestia sp. YIM B13486]|uniref:SIR2 family protein n=1 Tax=Priestia sp. YIM B13486 TaxID=3366304 RepID=UPI003673625C
MSLERLINRIKNNEVILWAGSGFSSYAGMPSVKEIKEEILNLCNEEEKEYLQGISDLSDISGNFVEMRNNSRNDLNRILTKLIDIDPNSIKIHKLLTEIPQIDTIVTTNYDTLFEEAYGRDLSPIIQNSNIPYTGDKKIKLYKIHGDIKQLDTIVITKDDYTNFFRKSDEPIWNKIKSLLSEKTILFVGYSLSDQNIDYLLDNVVANLGNNINESFLVTPDLPKHKVSKLLQKKVEYIPMTGEELVETIHTEIKERENNSLDAAKTDVNSEKSAIKQLMEISILISNPLDTNIDYDVEKILKHFNKFDLHVNFYYLTEDSLNSLTGSKYVFIFSSIIEGQIIIEDSYLKATPVPLFKLEDMTDHSSIEGIFLFTMDDFNASEIGTTSLPMLISKLGKESELSNILFRIFRKNSIDKIPNSIIFNEENIDLIPVGNKTNNSVQNMKSTPFIAEEIHPKNLVNFVGRQTDIEDIIRKILDQKQQILTIKGSGGIGKTTIISKVALELAKRNYFSEGFYFIDCEHITTYTVFEQKLATCFNLDKTLNFKEHLKQNYFKTDKLIILDNLESLLYVKEISQIKSLINFICDYSQIVITSREWVGFNFENRHELRTLSTEEASELFCKLYRVKRTEVEIKILKEEILEKLLNNNPLAIKLITQTSLNNMSMVSLKNELKDDFFSVTSLDYEDIYNEAVDKNIERSESLFHSINYSYKRLKRNEQLALEMLSLFPNGISLGNFKAFFNFKELNVNSHKISYRELKSLENKSLVESSGEFVKLQSIIGRFAEVHFEKRNEQEKAFYYKRAYKYNSYLADMIYYMQTFDENLSQKIYDKNKENIIKAINYLSKVEVDKVEKLEYISTLTAITLGLDIPDDFLTSCEALEGHFDENESWSTYFKVVLCKIKYFKGNFSDAYNRLCELVPFEDLHTFEGDRFLGGIQSYAITLYTIQGKDFEVLQKFLDSKLSSSNFDDVPNILFKLGYYNALNKFTSPFIMKQDQFFLLEAKANKKELGVEEIEKYIEKLYKKLRLEIMQSTYIRAKIEPYSLKELRDLVVTNPYTLGLKNLMVAFVTVEQRDAIQLYESAIEYLSHIKYYYIEAIYLYCKYLKEIESKNYYYWYERGIKLAEHHWYRFLIHQFKCLENNSSALYNEEDYPIPFEIPDLFIEKVEKLANKTLTSHEKYIKKYM